MIKRISMYLAGMAALLSLSSCIERNPMLFGDLSGLYFNYTESGAVSGSMEVTFAYEDNDYMEVTVPVQLLGKPHDEDRPVSVVAYSDNPAGSGFADAGDGEYLLPDEKDVYMPAGASLMEYKIKLMKTGLSEDVKKRITIELRSNGYFELPVKTIEQASGKVDILKFDIVFSNVMTKPPTWDDDILGEFSQQKIELLCDVLDVDMKDFLDPETMPSNRQNIISQEMTAYVDAEWKKNEAGQPFDERILDDNKNKLVFAPKND